MAGRFHAVSIRARGGGCSAAQAVAETRFLALEAPSLPLKYCPQPHNCRCRYKHYADRRDGPRRDADVGLPGIFWALEERRTDSGGRRATDRPAA